MLVLIAALLLGGAFLGAQRSTESPETPASPQRAGLYADEPHHLWNRIHEQLFVRRVPRAGEAGWDEVDPLLWRETRHLLTEPSHTRAIRLLDEFVEARGERLVTDPLKRAVFQHDLWAVFDWLVGVANASSEARTALMARLARMIRRVALTREEIERLPDNYAAAVASGAFPDRYDPSRPGRPFLPGDMFDVGGSWVIVSGNSPVAVRHAGELSRSAFSVVWRVPGGASATRRYLDELWDFPEPYVGDRVAPEGERRVVPNPRLPAVPEGSHLALVRRMLLVDQQGTVIPSSITEQIQLRVVFERDQRFFEFRTRRRRLFAGETGGLETVRQGDRSFITFSSHGVDPFERSGAMPPGVETLTTCRMCHHEPPAVPLLNSILSVQQLLKPHAIADSRHERWSRWFTPGAVAAEAKTRRADWGLLQGIWQTSPF